MPRLSLLLIGLLLSAAVPAQSPSRLVDAGGPGGVRLAAGESPDEQRVYIVQMARPAAAEFFASQVPFSPSAAKTRKVFTKANPSVRDYAESLSAEQDRLLLSKAAGAEKIYSYTYGFNGFAAKMTATQADKLSALPEVVQVWEDEIRPLATNFSAEFLELFDNTKGLRGPRGLTGEDVVIGFIDSGVYPEHPQLDDTREADRPRACRSNWGRTSLLGRWLCGRYDDMEDALEYEPPEDWNGTCQAGEQFEDTLCNNKLIGARYFIDGAEASGPIDAGEIRSARDVDGHGTHTATTGAGNRENAALFGSFVGTVEGIAPRARVAVYKACWLRPDATRASCNTSDLANAIDAAVADGVDIISYSVGSSFLRVTSPDDIALAGATKAGVLAVVAAGNDGPNLGTIGSPAGGPWAITAAASTREGETSVEAMQVESPSSIAGKYAVREASFTPPLSDVDPIEAELVLVDDGDDTLAAGGAGTTADACEALVNTSELEGKIAFIERGGCDFDIKVSNAEDAGAIAALVYSIAGDAIVMNGAPGLVDIPALMIGQADGNLILAELEADNVVNAVLDKGLFLTEAETGNRMATFSARGPAPAPAILKPDVTAPGVNILAGFTPEAANTMSGETYAYLSGTSMATPHVSGIAALLLEANPDWSPSALKSALMTSARQDISRDDEEAPATPFDFGAGHIVPNDAVEPGLVYLTSNDEYDAFACAAEFPAISQARCDELSNQGQSFMPSDLNSPSIAIARLASERTVTRRVTNVGDESQTFVVDVSAPAGMSMTVSPSTLTLGPGETGSFTVRLAYVSGPLDLWRFGEYTWRSDDHVVRSPVAVRPVSLTAPVEITSFGGTGTAAFDVEFGYTGAYTPGVHGLNLPLIVNGFVDNDPTKTFSFRSTGGVTVHLIDVPENQLYLRFALFDALTDGDDDLDLYIYYCPDNVNCNRIGVSGEPTSQEQFNQAVPAAGRYAVLVHGFETDQVAGGPGSNYTLLAWSFGLIDDALNLRAEGPAFVTAGSTETITINWENLQTDTIYLGGISHNTPQGLVELTIVTIGN